MPLFNCSKCGVVENTALGAYWYEKAKGKPVLCSECDTGAWHGRFTKSYEAVTSDALQAAALRSIPTPSGGQ